jgi:membrane-associated protein
VLVGIGAAVVPVALGALWKIMRSKRQPSRSAD